MQAFEEEMLKSIMNRFLNKGLVVAPAADGISGRYLIQPEVTVDGDTVLLDECLGSGFAIIGYDCDPRQHIDSELLELWQGIGTRVLQIASPAGNHDAAGVSDHTGAIGAWLGEGRAVELTAVCASQVA